MNLVYLGLLTFSLVGMALFDYKWKLAFWASPLRATLTMLVGILVFLIWDIAGIVSGIFFVGNPAVLSGIYLGPELPLEEIFFLALLCYSALQSFIAAQRTVLLIDRRRGR